MRSKVPLRKPKKRECNVKKVIFVGGFVAVCLATGSFVWGQDPVKVAPDIYKVRLENDQVRVLDIHRKPEAKSPTHSHPAYVVVALSPEREDSRCPADRRSRWK
jgi:hypothetical protein